MMEAPNTTACSSRLFYFSQKKTWLHVAQGWLHSPHTLQVTLEDSGSALARATNPNINDQKCNRGQCSLCEVSAPVRKVAIRGLCLLSIFDRSTYHPFQFCFCILTVNQSSENSFHIWVVLSVYMVLLSPGLTITSSTRTVSQCLLGPTLLLSSTTEPWAPGSGKKNGVQ